MSNISINGKNLTRKNIAIGSLQEQILPGLHFLTEDPNDSNGWVATRNPWRSDVIRLIAGKVHGNTSNETINSIANQLIVGSKRDLLSTIKKINGPSGWQSMKKSLTESSLFLNQLSESLVAANLDQLLDMLDEALASIFTGVRYLKPLRATAERYYRRLDLAVSEIDPEGRNFPMFLDSLSARDLESFRNWIKEALSIDVIPKREGAQLTVMARNIVDDTFTNIADMGFGISQILPIAAQLWSSSHPTTRSTKASFIVIEQPELHLHPEYQARLGDVFSAFANNSSKRSVSTNPPPSPTNTSLIIETHSQHLVNRLGALIEQKIIDPEDVSIVLFEPSEVMPGMTGCRISKFDENGVLMNWPYGFFDPES